MNKPSKYAFCVGINDYPGTGSDLSGCVNDAEDWKAELENRGYEVALLLDGQATRSNMLEGLKGLIGNASPGDKLVFTFSGHGSWLPDENGDEADGRDEMLCPHDISSNQYLLDDDLATVFNDKPKGANLYFISDSCHSGSVARFAPLFPDAAAQHPIPRFLPPSVFVTDEAVLRNCERVARYARSTREALPALLFAGCQDIQFSYDANFNGRPNGAFTYFALQKLGNNPSTPRKWMDKIREHLPSQYYLQTPQLFGTNAAKDGPMF